MKKIISKPGVLFIALILCLSTAACQGKSDYEIACELFGNQFCFVAAYYLGNFYTG